MYHLLRRFMPEKAADILMILWYLFLCIGIYIFSVDPDAGFVYLKM